MGFADNWPDFGGDSLQPSEDSDDSLAVNVLNSFNIPINGTGGGFLNGIDIKNMGALEVINASLFEGLTDGNLYELINNEDGELEIITVEGRTANITNTYYTTQSFSYKQNYVSGVMVTGGRPAPERRIGTSKELLGIGNNAKIWSDYHYIMSACTMPEIKKYCTITYDDPHLDSQYKDGIDNFFEVTSPFENIVGYVYRISRGSYANEKTEISFNNKSKVPLDAGNYLGTLQVPDYPDPSFAGREQDCLRGLADPSTGYSIEVEVPSELASSKLRNTRVPKISGIESVHIIGKEVNYWITPASADKSLEGPSRDNAIVWIDGTDYNQDVVQLDQGRNYATKVEGSRGFLSSIKIGFADRTVYGFAGLDLFGDGKTVYITANSPIARETGARKLEGVSILPLDDTKAVLVDNILVSLSVDTPSIEVFDPEGNAEQIAEDLSVRLSPIIIRKEPAPVAYNGSSVDLSDGVQDHDPTTTQNLSDTDYERKVNDMEEAGGGMSFTLNSLSEAQTVSLSKTLYDFYENDEGINTVYTCGPDLNVPEVRLGDRAPSGGVVNKIEYRYADSNSYTITVHEGSILSSLKLGSLSGDTHVKKTEDTSANGTIIQDLGNGSKFKVMVDGIGVRTALNTCSDVIRSGDRVSVTIHNNPVEE